MTLSAPARAGIGLLGGLLLTLSLLVGAAPVDATHGPDHSYFILESTDTIIPGATEIGLAGEDDTTVTVALPFDVTFYGATYASGTNLVVSSNGNIQFTGDDSDYPDGGECMPENDFEATLFALFSDIYLDNSPADGVFTSLVGSAPDRRFVIEWRGIDLDTDDPVNFEIVLYESSPVLTVIYGDMGTTEDGMIGVQETSSGPFTEYTCQADPAGVQVVADGTRLDFVPAGMTGDITVNKSGPAGSPLASVGFTLMADDCTTEVAAEQLTDATGTTVFTGVDVGADYCVVETSPPSGYTAVSVDVTWTFDPDTGLFSAVVPVVNTPVGASATPTPTPATSSLPNTAGSVASRDGAGPTLVIGMVALVVVAAAAVATTRTRRAA